MSKTQSVMVELGTVAPAFELLDVVSGRAMGRDDIVAMAWDDNASDGAIREGLNASGDGRRGLLVMFLCVHCPYVKHVEEELARIGKDYEGKVGMVAISSNDVEAYPEDGPEEMKKQAERLGFTFPYLYDPTQEVARHYAAACTPDFFLFDRAMKLVYRGQLDDSRPRRGDAGNDMPVTGKDLRTALDAVVRGVRPDPNQRQSIGCNIKWREAKAYQELPTGSETSQNKTFLTGTGVVQSTQLKTTEERTTMDAVLDGLKAGIVQFQTKIYPPLQQTYQSAATTPQQPHTLFITCADSRIDAETITNSGPGDLFITRNVGNMVPAYGEMLGGVSAVIEYAVSALKVKHVVVCGHMDCGAMKALLHPEATATMPTVSSWLKNAAAALSVTHSRVGKDEQPSELLRRLTEENVLLQLQHLRTHPSVAGALAANQLTVSGWVYDIGTGSIRISEDGQREFHAVAAEEAMETAAL